MSVDAVTPPSQAIGASDPWWVRLDPRTRASILVVEVALLLLAWQVSVGTLRVINPVFLPPPLAIGGGAMELLERADLGKHVAASLTAWLIGYVLAVLVGVSLGILLGRVLPVDRLAGPLLWVLYATPWLAYRPLTLVWFGFGLAPIVFLVFIASVFPTLWNTAAGVKAAEGSLVDAGRVFGVGGVAMYRKVLLPAALPYVLTGMRQSVVVASIALVVAEMTGAASGIGSLIAIQTNRYQTDQVFALVLIAVLWSVGLSQLIGWMGRRLAPWQTDAREA